MDKRFSNETGHTGGYAFRDAHASQTAALLRRAVELMQISAGGGQIPTFSDALGTVPNAVEMPRTSSPARVDDSFMPIAAAPDAPPMTREQFAESQQQMFDEIVAAARTSGFGIGRDDANARQPGGRLGLPAEVLPWISGGAHSLLPGSQFARALGLPQADLPGANGPARSTPPSVSDLLWRRPDAAESATAVQLPVYRFGEAAMPRMDLLAEGSPGEPSRWQASQSETIAQPGNHAPTASEPAKRPVSRSADRPFGGSVRFEVAVTNFDQQAAAAFARLEERLMQNLRQLITSEVNKSNLWHSAQRRAILGG